MFSWHTGSRWIDERLVLGFITWHDTRLIGVMSDTLNVQQLREPAITGKWVHYALTFDGANMCIYTNGDPLCWVPQSVMPKVADVPLRIGIVEGLGTPFFSGLITDMRVYTRGLSAREVARHFSTGARSLGLREELTVRLTTNLYGTREELVVEADLAKLGALPEGAVVRMSLLDAQGETVQDERRQIAPAAEAVGVPFKTDQLAAGRYTLKAVAEGADGKQLCPEAVKQWCFPRAAERIGAGRNRRLLNNLVAELMARDVLPQRAYQELTFDNFRDGWVFVSAAAAFDGDGTVTISIDNDEAEAVIRLAPGMDGPGEAMRHLTAGGHRLRVWSNAGAGTARPVVRDVCVRTVPEMMFCAVPATAHSGYGIYDMAFLEKDVLPNINAIVGSGHEKYHAWQEAWKERGGKWYLEQNIPTLITKYLKDVPNPLTGDYAFDYWSKSAGFTNPYLDGVLADEFSGGNSPDFDGYMEAIDRIAADARFMGRAVHAWCGSMYVPSKARDFAEKVVAAGYKLAWEVYLPELPSADETRQFLNTDIRRELRRWEDAFPCFPEKLIFVLGILCAPPESLNGNPHVDYKVFLDMQYHYLANAPECFGLYGVMVYKSSYAEEEAIRWVGRLFRHYCIEGNTEPLAPRYGYKYQLDYIRNADFDDGLDKWDVSEADAGSVKPVTMKGAGTLLGRYKAPGSGDRYLWMKRCRSRPNRVSQEIRGLEPGKRYSMKMIVADWQDVSQGRPEKKRHAASVRIGGVEIDAGKSFVSDVRGIYRVGVFAGKESGPWLNHHRIVFKATQPTAQLTISDWASDAEPGGPIGQELMCNFVEIQPYFDSP